MPESHAHPPIPQPGPEHTNLARFAGRWRAEVQIWMNPAGPPAVSHGTMINTLILNGLFVQHEYQDDAGLFMGRGFWGYNTSDRRYEGLWIDAMATWFQLEHGQYDPVRDTFTMVGTMTDPASGQPLQKRTVIRVLSDKEHTVEMCFQAGAGAERKAMEIRYTRA